jgi:hypothetical protein
MTKPTIRIHDIETNEVIDREMTDAEFAQFEIEQSEAEAKAASELMKATEKTALLAQLGITDEQAKLLLS